MAEEDLSSATFITMMQSADFRNSYDSSQSLPLNRTRFRRILCQRQMSPGIQIVTEVSFENPSQMRLSEHDDVVEAFPANTSNSITRYFAASRWGKSIVYRMLRILAKECVQLRLACSAGVSPVRAKVRAL